MEGFVKEKSEIGIHGLFHMQNCWFVSTLPEEFCPWRAELEDSANQTLSLIKRWRGIGEVEFTVRSTKRPNAAVRKKEHTQCFGWVQNKSPGDYCATANWD